MNYEKIEKTKHAEGEEDASFGKLPRRGKEAMPPGFETYQKEIQDFIDGHRRFFATFAKDISLRFIASDRFQINLETGEVHLAASWFRDKRYSRDQILWANLHELSHFRDLAEDPEGVFKNYTYIKQSARKTGRVILKKWEDKYGASDPEFIARLKKQKPVSRKKPAETMNAAEQAAYQIHHRFYNILDDIYVNNQVARRAPKYERGSGGGEEVEKLYREELFQKNDYTASPRHLQFLDPLIRKEEVPGEEIIVGSEVKKILDTKIPFLGKEYTPREIVENFIKPRKNRDTKAGRRYLVLQKTIEPIFKELLLRDLDEWDPQKPPESEQGEGEQKDEAEQGGEPPQDANPFSDDYKEFDEANPDQFDDEEVEDWVNKDKADKAEKEAERKRSEAEAAKTPEEKAKDAQAELDQRWCAQNNITPEVFGKFKQREAEVAPYLDDLARLWRRIVFGSSKKMERGIEGHFATGTELDVQEAINEWSKIQKGDLEKVKVMKKMVTRETLVEKPEIIRVRVVGDLSGSMDSAKRKILEQCLVLLLSSLHEFNTYLNLTRAQTRTKLTADTEAWVFGDREKTKKVKRLRSDAAGEEEQATIVRMFEDLRETLGGTYDHVPLEMIFSELTPEDKEKIANGKIMEILFEITDGESSDAAAAENAVTLLAQAGVIARAFQIGDVGADKRQRFDQVWNSGRKEAWGYVIGENIENLLPAVTILLKQYLGNVRL